MILRRTERGLFFIAGPRPRTLGIGGIASHVGGADDPFGR